MKIPFGKPFIDKSEKIIIKKVLSQPILAHGKQTKEFEKKFRNFTKAKYALSTSSCTASMHLFYMAIGLKKNDEVILPAQTHVATAHAIEALGAKPIFVDVSSDNGNIITQNIEKKINKRTKVITIVHFVGIPVDMPSILKIAKKYNLYVLEDCALALGSKIKNKHVGLWGDAGAFSFYPVKHITTGEGGMIISKNLKLKKKIILLKSLGVNKNFLDRKTPGLYDCPSFGLNFRMSEISSALGICQLKKINVILSKRKKNFDYLNKKLENVKYFKILKNKIINFTSSNYCLIVILKDSKLIKNREKIIKYLNNSGVGTSIYYPHPVSSMSYYRKKYKLKKKNFKYSEAISNHSIALPVGPHLNKSKIDFMANKIVFISNKIINL